MGVYKLSTAGGLATPRTNYSSFLAGNPAVRFGAYESIATVTVGSGGSSSISFTSIPSTYKHLQVRFLAQDTRAGYYVGDMNMRFNSSSTGYAFHLLTGNGSAILIDKGTSYAEIYIGSGSIGTTTGGTFGAGVIDILDYTSTSKYKTTRTLVGNDHNGTGGTGSLGGRITLTSGLWQNTNAINEITIYGGTGNLAQYSSFALYGIKGA
jgi:hypothetical protein